MVKRIRGLPGEFKGKLGKFLAPQNFLEGRVAQTQRPLEYKLSDLGGKERKYASFISQLERQARSAASAYRKQQEEQRQYDLFNAKNNLFTLYNQLAVNPNITRQALTNLINSRTRQLVEQYPGSELDIAYYGQSLLPKEGRASQSETSGGGFFGGYGGL